MKTPLQQRGGVWEEPTPQKHATIKSEPVLSFDNKSNDSLPVELLTIPETARFLKVSITAIRRLQQKRYLPFFKVGGSVRFAVNDVVSYLRKQRVESVDQ